MEEEKPVVRGFFVTSRGDEWIFKCKSCDTRWALLKTSKAPGNLLHLLNHTAQHDAEE